MRAAAAFLALLIGCAPRVVAPVPRPAPAPARAQVTVEPAPAPNDAVSSLPPSLTREPGGPSLRSLEVTGFQPAWLYSPGGSELRPLLVATHGAGGSPAWDCEYWTRLTAGKVFVLCLAGTPLGSSPGFYYRDHHALERELRAVEAAARAAEPRIAPDSGVYAGFSQGSTMGTSMIGAHGAAFPYLLLVESFQLWNIAAARAYAGAGGRRVLIVCGSKECAKLGKDSVRYLEAGGVSARLEFAPGAGHTPTGAVQGRVERALPWLLDGDPLWRD